MILALGLVRCRSWVLSLASQCAFMPHPRFVGGDHVVELGLPVSRSRTLTPA